MYWLVDMDLDGTVASIYRDLTAAKTKNPCTSEEKSADKRKGLSPYQMCGVWVIHGGVCLCVLVCAAVKRLAYPPRENASGNAKPDVRASTKHDLAQLENVLIRHLTSLDSEKTSRTHRKRFEQKRMESVTLSDTDRDDLQDALHTEEVFAELLKIDPNLQKEAAMAWIREADADGDGLIEVDEFLVLMERFKHEGLGSSESTADGQHPFMRAKLSAAALAAEERAFVKGASDPIELDALALDEKEPTHTDAVLPGWVCG